MTVAKSNRKHKKPMDSRNKRNIARTEGAPVATCQKKPYRTKRKAIVALDRIRAFKDAHADAPSYAYQCPRCGLWHLTSQKQGSR